MICPHFPKFKQMCRSANLIPVVKELIFDFETPVATFQKIAAKETNAFLLESVEYGEKIGRFSFIGFDPKIILRKTKEGVFLTERNRKDKALGHVDLLDVMKGIIDGVTFAPLEGLPALSGGFVGFLSYEAVGDFEDVQLTAKKSLNIPEAVFFLVDELVVFDHLNKKVKIVVLASTKKTSPAAAYNDSLRKIKRIQKRVYEVNVLNTACKSRSGKKTAITSNMTCSAFKSNVKKIKEYIKSGDVIQTVFSQRFSLGRVKDDFAIYRALRTVNPSPYMFYFRNGDIRLIGASPEMLVKKEGRTAQVRPIAGTRRRGKTEQEDVRLETELKNDKKEMAEHLMLVDLGRNDIGRVCKYKTIEVRNYAHIERYSHVMHLVSEVHGVLKKGKDGFDLLRATFPAGTVTGAPKIRAMEIIDELEPTERGPYAGSVGYFDFSGDLDMCITIRTIVVKGEKAYLQAGAGIVFDSVPEREYVETLNKARALFQALELVQNDLE